MSTTAKNLWLLVEWIDRKKSTPSYGTVDANRLKNEDSEEPLRPGKILVKCPRHNTSRRAKILLVSDSKKYIKEQKKLLKSHDKQIKKAQKRKAEEDTLNLEQPTSSSDIPMVPDVMDLQNHSDCDSQFDSEQPSSSSDFLTLDSTDPYDHSCSDSEDDEVALNLSTKDKTSDCNKSTPPFSSGSAEENVDLPNDQGTEPKIKELQGGGKIVSKSLDNLKPQLNGRNSEDAASISEHNNGPSHIVQNGDESKIEPNNGEESHGDEQQKNSSPQVLQMSAQNTENKENVNNVETVTIVHYV